MMVIINKVNQIKIRRLVNKKKRTEKIISN